MFNILFVTDLWVWVADWIDLWTLQNHVKNIFCGSNLQINAKSLNSNESIVYLFLIFEINSVISNFNQNR